MRTQAPWAAAERRELVRPWKLATFAVGMAWLLYGALVYEISDWDVGISVLMGGFTYWLAPWTVRSFAAAVRAPSAANAGWAALGVAAAWWCVDGVYVLYHTLAGNAMLRDANFRASLPLFFLCGMLWLYRGSLAELRLDLARLCERPQTGG